MRASSNWRWAVRSVSIATDSRKRTGSPSAPKTAPPNAPAEKTSDWPIHAVQTRSLCSGVSSFLHGRTPSTFAQLVTDPENDNPDERQGGHQNQAKTEFQLPDDQHGEEDQHHELEKKADVMSHDAGGRIEQREGQHAIRPDAARVTGGL